MAPNLSSLQKFVAGLVLAGLGIVATLFGTEFANGMIGPDGVPSFFAMRAADLLAQILLTLGLGACRRVASGTDDGAASQTTG